MKKRTDQLKLFTKVTIELLLSEREQEGSKWYCNKRIEMRAKGIGERFDTKKY